MINPTINTRNLPVYTTAGRYLGRVVGVDIDPISQKVITYQVSTPWSIPRLWNKCLIISAEQVVSITPSGILVDDKDKRAVSVSEKNPSLVIEST